MAANKNNRRKASPRQEGQASTAAAANALQPVTPEQLVARIEPQWYAIAAVIVLCFAWAYWPTISVELWDKWWAIQDYSHGFLVLPLALYALWVRLDKFPHGQIKWTWFGLVVIGISLLIRIIGGLFFLGGVDGWSILVWVAGVCLLCGGWRFFLWALPGVAFLVFMIPLPYQVEGFLRRPLQTVATNSSVWVLQCLGQPAIGRGHTIWLNEHELEVAQACSGLRIFVTIAVIAFAYVLIVRPKWWETAALVVSVFPVALLSNIIRIVITGFLHQFISSEAANRFTHDLAGWAMIPVAAVLYMSLLWYMSKLVKRVELSDMRQMFRPGAA